MVVETFNMYCLFHFNVVLIFTILTRIEIYFSLNTMFEKDCTVIPANKEFYNQSWDLEKMYFVFASKELMVASIFFLCKD